ncbi:SMI1/KNR4 family protein [Nocardia spumae]|uniref:SMI1/KNR4 family protein n=1 Tax=Nocardia spumae TaxID=2887190 RepID=UPI001D154EAF|nr:SMI1/KNR4 family protein [Nocardia spumae]
MTDLDELMRLLGSPSLRRPAGDWAEVESYIGSGLPSDFKAFLDTYGSGVISGELVVFHPQGTSSPLLPRMRTIHETFGELREDDPDDVPYPIHPEPGGLISWGYDYSGDEHFFLPCDPDPERWKIVTMVHEVGTEVFDGPFSGFVLHFVDRLRNPKSEDVVDRAELEFLEPQDVDELIADRAVQPSFESF